MGKKKGGKEGDMTKKEEDKREEGGEEGGGSTLLSELLNDHNIISKTFVYRSVCLIILIVLSNYKPEQHFDTDNSCRK